MQLRTLLSPLAACSLVLGMGALGAPAQAGGRPLTAELSGDNEVPGPGDPDGAGVAHLTLNQGQGRICWEIDATDIATPTAAHIHTGSAGFSGGVVVALFSGPTTLPAAGCVEDVDRALVKEIRKDPGEYYVNVHNAEFPAGAIRGQLAK